jgi:CubicO group peptidase (beta-lactamase class C family)
MTYGWLVGEVIRRVTGSKPGEYFQIAIARRTARSLARLYGACVSEVDGLRLMSEASIEDAISALSQGPQLSGMPDDGARLGTGFQLSSPPTHPMLGSTSFGHAGAGGQLALADPDAEVSFTHLSGQMGGYSDGRARAQTQALAEVVT